MPKYVHILLHLGYTRREVRLYIPIYLLLGKETQKIGADELRMVTYRW